MEVCPLAKDSHDKVPQLKVTETCRLTALEPQSLESSSLLHQAPFQSPVGRFSCPPPASYSPTSVCNLGSITSSVV